jgi:hypothetical protein
MIWVGKGLAGLGLAWLGCDGARMHSVGLTKVFAIFRKEDFSRAKVKPTSHRIVCGELWAVCFGPPITLLELSPVISVVSIRPGSCESVREPRSQMLQSPCVYIREDRTGHGGVWQVSEENQHLFSGSRDVDVPMLPTRVSLYVEVRVAKSNGNAPREEVVIRH